MIDIAPDCPNLLHEIQLDDIYEDNVIEQKIEQIQDLKLENRERPSCNSESMVSTGWNHFLTNNSMSTLVALCQVRISCNKINFKYNNVSVKYTKKYEKWMQDAVSDFIRKVDAIHVFDKFVDNYFDIKLTSLEYTKMVRVYATNNDFYVELFFDTVFYDHGLWI